MAATDKKQRSTSACIMQANRTARNKAAAKARIARRKLSKPQVYWGWMPIRGLARRLRRNKSLIGVFNVPSSSVAS
jgi:hypothetical protein